MILGGCFDNGWRRAEIATRYEHGAGHTTYLHVADLLHIIIASVSGLGVSSEI